MTTEATAIVEAFLEYRAASAVNHSRLSKMSVSALAYKINADIPQTKALILGRLNHLCTLEPEIFEETAVVWAGGMTRPKSGEPKPTMSKTSADYKEFKEEQEALGHVVVSQSAIGKCERIARRVQQHPTASTLLEGAQNELSIYWEHPLGVQCKSRIDALSNAIVDLKFLADVTQRKVNRAIIDYKYDSQAAMYQDAVLALTGEKLPYFIVAAEKTDPLDVVVYELDDEILGLGRQKYTSWMERYVECRMNDRWPGISATPINAELPEWAYQDFDDGKVYFDGVEVSV